MLKNLWIALAMLLGCVGYYLPAQAETDVEIAKRLAESRYFIVDGDLTFQPYAEEDARDLDLGRELKMRSPDEDKRVVYIRIIKVTGSEQIPNSSLWGSVFSGLGLEWPSQNVQLETGETVTYDDGGFKGYTLHDRLGSPFYVYRAQMIKGTSEALKFAKEMVQSSKKFARSARGYREPTAVVMVADDEASKDLQALAGLQSIYISTEEAQKIAEQSKFFKNHQHDKNFTYATCDRYVQD